MGTPRTTAVRDLVTIAAQLADLAARLAVADEAEPDEILTLEAAGAVVGKSPRAIRDAGRRGDIEIVSVGRSPRVRRSALLSWARPVTSTKTADETMSPREAARAAVAARAAGGGR